MQHAYDPRGEFHLIVVASHDMYVRCYSTQILIRLLVTNVPSAEYLLDFPRNEKFLELCREVVNTVWNVEVANDENEDHCASETLPFTVVWHPSNLEDICHWTWQAVCHHNAHLSSMNTIPASMPGSRAT
jgi:hypothetical protein